ncbi:hypothetical protein [Halostella salina]|uniref:hypothetical protein n=1 Tax=Halostella salina TaxID=1547897 RepID=UPI000EF76C11|nr:hypothetical protein [Halostella salina]
MSSRGQQQQPRQTGQARQAGQTTQSPTDGFRPVGGLIYGVIGFVAAFVVTVVYFFYRIDEITGGTVDSVLPDDPVALGWPFYNAHKVDITTSVGSTSINYLEEIPQLDPLVFNAIPAVILFLAGFAVARRVQEPLSDEANAVAGASVAVGYVPVLAAGTVAFTVEEAGVSIGPELGLSLVLWGLLFSAGFGAIGGYLGG